MAVKILVLSLIRKSVRDVGSENRCIEWRYEALLRGQVFFPEDGSGNLLPDLCRGHSLHSSGRRDGTSSSVKVGHMVIWTGHAERLIGFELLDHID